MTTVPSLPSFHPRSPDAAGIVSWAHIGDLHMTEARQQNDLDLLYIVDELNRAFQDSIAFVYLPGDVADQGATAQYRLVRQSLDLVRIPWCAIVGDHDVHEKNFANFLRFMAHETYYSFEVGAFRFLALNAFDVPDPGSFTLLPAQLGWIEQQINEAKEQEQSVVLLLHCYPSDLKQGSQELSKLVERSSVRLIDMGHTHYNELANDGKTLYTATRSTGQIEEGPVGFSITNIDGQVISWKFLSLNELPAVMITSPADERFITDATLDGHFSEDNIVVRVKAWANAPVVSASVAFESQIVPLAQIPGSNVWQGEMRRVGVADGVYPLSATVVDTYGNRAEDTIRMVLGRDSYKVVERSIRDQDNAVGAWPERGLMGTQLGPNRNGRKW